MGETLKYVLSHKYVHGEHHARNSGRGAQADEALHRDPLERGGSEIHRGTPRSARARESDPPQEQTHRERYERVRELHYTESGRAFPKVVIDANILFAALIRNSSTRELLFRYPSDILTPVYVFEELQKYWKYLLRKSGLSAMAFNAAFGEIIARITVIPTEQLMPYGPIASAIMCDIDPKDDLYVACALAYPGSIIWSEDKALKRQHRVPVLNTAEMLDLL